MRIGGTSDNDDVAGLEIVDADGGSTPPLESVAATQTSSKSRPLAMVLGLFVAGWLGLALLLPQDMATTASPPSTAIDPDLRPTLAPTTTIDPPPDSTIASSTTEPAFVAPPVLDLNGQWPALENTDGATVRVVVDSSPQTLWELDLQTGTATQFEVSDLSSRTRISLRFVNRSTLYGLEEIDRHIALVTLGENPGDAATELYSFRPAGGAPTGWRGLDASGAGAPAMWATSSSGLTRYQLDTGEVDAQWNDPDRNFALTPEIRGVSNGRLIVESPVGTNHAIDEQGNVGSLGNLETRGRIDVVAGTWAIVTGCDSSLNCEEVSVTNLEQPNQTVALGPWRSFVPECVIETPNGFAAAGVDIEGALVLVEFDAASSNLQTTVLATKSLACVSLAKIDGRQRSYVMAHSRGALVVVDTSSETPSTTEIDLRQLGEKAVSVAG